MNDPAVVLRPIHRRKHRSGGPVVESFFLDVWNKGGVAKIVCKGELDVATAGHLREAIAELITHRPEKLLLDCSGITFLSAAGITALVEAVNSSKEHSIRLELEISGKARRVLDVVGLWWLGVVDDWMAIDSALEEALRRYAEERRDLVT